MVTPDNYRDFYQYFSVDHFLYKSQTLLNILDNYDDLKDVILKNTEGIEDDKYRQMLKLELRATVFHAIETLFELVFALCPNDGLIDNRTVWYTISKGKNNYGKIEKVASGKFRLFDEKIKVGFSKDVNLINYIFYFHMNHSHPEAAEVSSEIIKRALVFLANEFALKDEYNAYKHGLRIFPTMNNFIVSKSKDIADKIVEFDMSSSVTYMRHVDDSIEQTIIPLDHMRDKNILELVHMLLSNIVRVRKSYFFKAQEEIAFLRVDPLNKIDQPSFNWNRFVFRYPA